MWAEHCEIRFSRPIELEDLSDFDRATLDELEQISGFQGRWFFINDGRTSVVSIRLWDTRAACDTGVALTETAPQVLAALTGETPEVSMGVYEVFRHPTISP